MVMKVDDIFDLGSLSDLSSDPGILSDDDTQISKKQSRKPAKDQQVQQQVVQAQSIPEISPSPSELPSTTPATPTTISLDTTNVSTPDTPHDHVEVKIEPENTATSLSSSLSNTKDDTVAKEDQVSCSNPNTMRYDD